MSSSTASSINGPTRNTVMSDSAGGGGGGGGWGVVACLCRYLIFGERVGEEGGREEGGRSDSEHPVKPWQR